MCDRVFELRLSCDYTGNGNDIKELEVEILDDAIWQTFDLSLQSPGFQIFVYSIFTCQHRMFRVTSAKQALLLFSSNGSMTLTTDKTWKITSLRVEFEGKLLTGEAGQGDIDSITSVMRTCPVSVNLPDNKEENYKIRFI